MRSAVWAAAALAVGACSSRSGNTNAGPAKAEVDQTALIFGLMMSHAVMVGTQPSDSVQVFNSGTGTVTISGAVIGTGANTLTQQLPVGPRGALVTQALAVDPTHSDFFTASSPSASSVSGTSASVIEVNFNPTLPGWFSAALNITTSTGVISVALTGEAVLPLIATGDGGTAYTVPTVPLALAIGDDGGPVVWPDGGPTYQTGYSSTIIRLYNPGSATLVIASDSESDNGEVWQLCRVMGPASTCTLTTGIPSPADLEPGYSDGGLAVGAGFDGGSVILSSDLEVYFSPAVPGTYRDTITVTSNAANTPTLTLTLIGTAVPPT